MKINNKIYHHYKSQLEIIAQTLAKDSQHPIDIIKICNELNISIDVDSSRVKKATLIGNNDNISILLALDYFNNRSSPFVRYIIAHEIGHYLLDRHLNFSGSNEYYWVTEELCDYFSRALLVPLEHSSFNIVDAKNDLIKIEQLIYKIVNEFNVTFVTSVQRIKDFMPELLFLNLKNSKDSTKFKVNKSLLLKNRYLNSSIAIPNKFIIQNNINKIKSILLKPNDEFFNALEKKFPFFFNKENMEFIVFFRHGDIAFMTINYTQQDI